MEMIKPISSQAKELKKSLEGSETTGSAKAMIPARVPSPSIEGEDIVRYSEETLRVSLNSLHNVCMSLVKPAHGNVIAQETVNGTMSLLESMERALFKGDSSLSSLQFDGYEKLMLDGAPSANIIDLRGKPLTEDILTDASLTVMDAPNYGTPTDLYLNPKVKADLVKTFFPKARYDQFQKTSDGLVGLDIAGFTSPAGDVRFQPDVFIDDGGAAPAVAAGDAAKAPAAPTVSTGPTTPVDAGSLFGADDAGDYFYKAAAFNRFGNSAAVEVPAGPTAVTVAAGDKVTFGLTPGSAVAVDWYEIYRTKKDGSAGTERQVLRIPNGAGAGEQIIDDLNASLPGTTSAYLFQLNSEAMSFKQLAPMVKVPLATIDSSIRWMQLLSLQVAVNDDCEREVGALAA